MTAPIPENPVEADPMLRVLREHHPDVDVVLLPGRVVPTQDSPLAGRADLDTLVDETEALLDALVGRLSRLEAWPQDVQCESRWRREPVAAEGTRSVHREVVLVAGNLGDGDNIALLRATGNALLGLGWLARPIAGTTPRLVARRGAFTASALARGDSLQVVIGSGHVLIEAEATS